MADFKQSRVGELTVKLDVDASDAIRALKAIQREARKATQALRELEADVAKAKTTNITVNIPNITVKDEADVEKIARELSKRLDKLLINASIS
jgi:phage-related minor tail protein